MITNHIKPTSILNLLLNLDSRGFVFNLLAHLQEKVQGTLIDADVSPRPGEISVDAAARLHLRVKVV
jgi:hypothetical protein